MQGSHRDAQEKFSNTKKTDDSKKMHKADRKWRDQRRNRRQGDE